MHRVFELLVGNSMKYGKDRVLPLKLSLRHPVYVQLAGSWAFVRKLGEVALVRVPDSGEHEG